MVTYQKKRVSHLLLLIILLALALSFTAVVQAGGPGEAVPPAGGPHPMGGPSGAMPPPSPDLANCIDVFAWYDGNFNGIVDANEDPMDGAGIRLMKSYPAPSTEPPIGPNGQPMTLPEAPMGPYGGPMMAPSGGPMRPYGGPMSPSGGPMAPSGGPMGPSDGPMGAPHGGPMPGMPMKNDGYAKFQVIDHKLTRDGGVTRFCDLQPGEYILQGDGPNGITYGDNRRFTTLQSGGYQKVTFGLGLLEETSASLNGSGS